MQSTEHGWVGTVFRVLAALGLIYMLLPITLMFPLSLEPGQMLRFPPQGFSLRWYREYFADDAWLESTILSLKVAAGAAAIATIFGTLAAAGLARASAAVRNACNVILMSALFLPTILVAVAIYGLYASLRLVGTPSGLIAAHAVLTLPFVILNVSTALGAVPRSLEEAASSLGATPFGSFFVVTMPLIWRGVAAGAVFAFLVSFDEVVIAMFLSGTQAVTLPKRMLDGVFYEMTPMLAAVSALMIIGNVLLMGIGLLLMPSRGYKLGSEAATDGQ
jgi:putative spermidine/putrescine transport system permease protein